MSQRRLFSTINVKATLGLTQRSPLTPLQKGGNIQSPPFEGGFRGIKISGFWWVSPKKCMKLFYDYGSNKRNNATVLLAIYPSAD